MISRVVFPYMCEGRFALDPKPQATTTAVVRLCMLPGHSNGYSYHNHRGLLSRRCRKSNLQVQQEDIEGIVVVKLIKHPTGSCYLADIPRICRNNLASLTN